MGHGRADQSWDVLALAERLGLEAERQRIITLIAPHVAADTRKPYTDAQVAEYQMNLYWFITGRRTDLETMLAVRSPMTSRNLRNPGWTRILRRFPPPRRPIGLGRKSKISLMA